MRVSLEVVNLDIGNLKAAEWEVGVAGAETLFIN